MAYELKRSKKIIEEIKLDNGTIIKAELNIHNIIMEYTKAYNNMIRLEKKLLRVCKRKRGLRNDKDHQTVQYRYQYFYDGLHPTDDLAKVWLRQLLAEDCHAEEDTEDHEDLAEDKEKNDWDFKRYKHQD